MTTAPAAAPAPEGKAMDLLDVQDALGDAKDFVLCAQMAVANFGQSDERVSAVQSATMAALERIEVVGAFLDNLAAREAVSS